MKSYPSVVGESATLDLVLAGRSLARYGDGELKMASHNCGIKSQVGDLRLSARLRQILHDSGDCLVGIPNIRSDTPKAEHWGKFMRYCALLADRAYVSSFVTRPDSAPWINVDDYWGRLESLWVGQDVTLVRGSGKSLVAEDLVGANMVTEIVAPRQHAWAEYESLLERIGTPARVLICLGPSATVMASDLCAKGVQGIDLGHVGMFLRKRRRGEPMWVSDDDKAHDKKAREKVPA